MERSICNAWHESIHNQVVSATHAALLRIAGGGYVVAPATAKPHGRTTTSHDDTTGVAPPAETKEWTEELREIASAVSFANGRNQSASAEEGKPHDVEVRAALTLFHRVRRGSGHLPPKGNAEAKGDRKLRKRKKGRPTNEAEEDAVFEVISDLGVHRHIRSIAYLAHLLSLELEKELILHESTTSARRPAHDQRGDTSTNTQTNNERPPPLVPLPSASIADIRPSTTSGIICLVSKRRARQLREAGRLPCAHCNGYFR